VHKQESSSQFSELGTENPGPWVHWDGLQQLGRRNSLLTFLDNNKMGIFKTRHMLFL